MPENQLPLPIARPHNNQQLFSDYYLDMLLPRQPYWSLLIEESEYARSVISAYLRSHELASAERWFESNGASAPVQLRRAAVRPAAGSVHDPIDVRTPFVIEVDYATAVMTAGTDTTASLPRCPTTSR